jgi:uncharacterized protein YbjT (DUF2867 family)
MIVITGATGQLGQQIVERLLQKLPAEQVSVSVQDPQKASDFAQRGVRVRRGDFGDSASLRQAFEGASKVLITSINDVGEKAVQKHRNAIKAAKAAGAQRILYTSQIAANPHSLFAPARDHAAAEADLQASGVPFTSLRNGFYAESALWLLGPFLDTGQIVAPEDGPVSWTARADLAEAAVIALTEEGRLDGITPPLTGSEALDFAAVAKIVSHFTGRKIRRITVSDGEYRESLLSHGAPEWRADMVLGIFAASRAGEFSVVTSTLETLLEHPPTSFRDVLASRIAHRQ